MTRAAQESRAVELVGRMGEIELRLWLLQGERLLAGQVAYGQFQSADDRRFVREALEECVDGLTYLGRELMRLESDGGGRAGF